MPSSTDARSDGPVETACDHIVVGGDQHGLWISAPPDLQCFAPRKAGAVDLAWLASELRTLKGALDPTCVPLVEFFGYRGEDPELGAVQDVVTKAGLTSRALVFEGSEPPNLATVVKKLGAPSSTPAHCPTPQRAGPMHPIVVITRTDISVIVHGRTQPIASIADVAHTADALPGLAAALGTPTLDRSFILQADADTHVRVINRVVNTARQGGFARMVMVVNK